MRVIQLISGKFPNFYRCFVSHLLTLGYSGFFLLSAFSPLAVFASPSPGFIPARKFKVCLDPGHGGGDHGAIYTSPDKKSRLSEKDAALKLALETKKLLVQAGYPVILTREIDAEISLNQRTAIANRMKSNIFISIHLNSAPKSSISGVETYILNNASDEMSKRIADLENKGLDPTQGSDFHSEDASAKEVNFILKDFVLDANLKESKRLACSLDKNLTRLTKQKHRGVKQALFVVLLGADMPSVLVEAGFITSSQDRSQFESPAQLAAMAKGISDAIDEYRRQSGSLSAQKALNNCQ